MHYGVRGIAHLLTDNAKESFSGDKGRGVLFRRLAIVWLWYCVYDAIPQPLKGEAEAEDDVVGARHPQGTVGLEDAPRLPEPPHVELVILRQAHKANRVTTIHSPLPCAPGRRRP